MSTLAGFSLNRRSIAISCQWNLHKPSSDRLLRLPGLWSRKLERLIGNSGVWKVAQPICGPLDVGVSRCGLARLIQLSTIQRWVPRSAFKSLAVDQPPA